MTHFSEILDSLIFSDDDRGMNFEKTLQEISRRLVKIMVELERRDEQPALMELFSANTRLHRARLALTEQKGGGDA